MTCVIWSSSCKSTMLMLVIPSPFHMSACGSATNNKVDEVGEGMNMMVSFDMVTLYTRVPIWEAIYLLAQCFEEGIMAIFCSVLTCFYFSFCHWFCGWTYTMVMGSLLVLCGQDLVIWPHRPEKLEEFVASPHRGTPSSLVFFIWHPSSVLFVIS